MSPIPAATMASQACPVVNNPNKMPISRPAHIPISAPAAAGGSRVEMR